MMKNPRSLLTLLIIGGLLMPVLAHAQDSEGPAREGMLLNLLWSIAPFIVLGILYFYFFIKKHPPSKAEMRQHAYWDRHEQHMRRVEALLERIAIALEKRNQ